jgi:hypothetical protein
MNGTQPANVKIFGRNVKAESVLSKKYDEHVLHKIADGE